MDLNGDWVLGQSTNEENNWSFNSSNNTTWEWQNGIASSGSSSIKVDRDDMIIGTSTEIVSKSYDLSDFKSGTNFHGRCCCKYIPRNELTVEYSRNCGEDWNTLGTITPLELLMQDFIQIVLNHRFQSGKILL